MHIINAMFGKGLGGIEQCFVDYADALRIEGHEVTCLIHPKAAIKSVLENINGINIIEISNRGQWDVFSAVRMRHILKKTKPDAIIAHGNRALRLLKTNKYAPVIGVTHNYSLSSMQYADAVITITKDLEETAIKRGVDETRILNVPNMVRLPEPTPKARKEMNNPPVIGAMGRLIQKKGFEIYVQALAILKNSGMPFRAVLAGTGDEVEPLKTLAKKEGLNDNDLEFLGWVENKDAFFKSIDVFCLPSNHEPFGIVLLEAFAHGLPVVSTASEGPREIVTDKKDALLCPVGDARALADTMQYLLENPKEARQLAETGLETVKKNYSLERVAKILSQEIERIIKQRDSAA